MTTSANKARIPFVVLFDEGREVWAGTLTQLARDNSRDLVRDIIRQWRTSLDVHGSPEPAFIGGGAAPEFMVCLSE